MRALAALPAGLLGLLTALAAACSTGRAPDQDGRVSDAAMADQRASADGRGDGTALDARRDAPGDARTPDGPRGDATAADRGPCQPVVPPRANAIDPCRLAHRPSDPRHLSSRTPTAIESVTVRLEATAGDVKKVVLRLWTGVLRELPMTLESSSAGLDIFKVTIPASARPTYYRFRLEDGSATLFLTAKGTRTAPTGADDYWLAPTASGKTLHYPTDLAQPELLLRGATGSYTKVAMSFESPLRAGATNLGAAKQELSFYLRDAKTGVEDRPPGGGDYRLPADLDEAWLEKGTLFDVPPELLDLGLVDVHTHPFDASWAYDPSPMTALLPANGITHALTMTPDTIALQLSRLAALHKAQRWIVPVVWVIPGQHAVADVEDLLAHHGFKAMKFHPTVHKFPADGAIVDPFMALAVKYKVPVAFHTATDDPSTPTRLVALARRYPTVPIVMMHTNLGALEKASTLALIQPVPNLYAETSWMNPSSVLEAMRTLDASRTLFGTDATVDGLQHFSKQSIANPQGQFVYTVPQVIAEVKVKAHPDAYANWARLTAIRLYGLRFRPDPDLLDTDGDGTPDATDADADNDGRVGAADPAPLDPSR
ncbi:MAG: amidohydrolase family protein [Deltaproteobacteria bacterium]|nr:amidohydrolase family protein [Deltaproteobacteria bacterium]